MKQQVHFCQSADKVRIAYATSGQGPPLVKAANYLTHLEHDWHSPVWRHWLQGLSETHRLIRYDARGSGLSDWDVSSYNMEAWIRDLEAVVDSLNLDRFPLLGISQGAAVCVAFAVRHPERVSGLILYGGYARGRYHRDLDSKGRLEAEALINLIRVGWGQENPAFRQLFSTMLMPEANLEQTASLNKLAQISTTPENASKMEHAFYQIDVRHLASKVKAPTLVLHARQDACIPLEEGRLLASMIPGSRFVQLESRNHVLIEQEPAWGRFRAAGRQSQDGPQLHEPHLYETGSTKSRASHRPGPRSGFREVDRPILVENTSDTYRNWDTSPFFHPQVAAKLVTGELLQPGDARYDEARQLYNGMVDKRPGLIARCVDLADVQASVNFARQKNLLLAVRGGGHNGAGLGSCDDGLVIDLSLMKGVHVDLATGTVRVEGGCTWGDVDHATHPFGLAVPTGFISTTGVGGLTLGGGLGYLTRRYGLTIDNLLEVEMVLADGRIITAGADQNEDLFWAVRGGGGNFGVVTSFLFRGCPVSTVYGGPMFWEMEHAATIMRYWRDLILKGQQEINGWFGFHTVPPVEMFPAEHHLKKMAVITWCYTGELAEAERVFEPIRHLAPRAIDFAQVIVGVDPDPANNERMIQWSKTYWEELHPYSAGGAYVNMIMEKGQDRIEAAYRDNYPRLAQIKARYDPDNLFRVNQNIRPATGS